MKKIIFIVFSILTLTFIYSADNSSDLNNKLTGTISRTYGNWDIDMHYNDIAIKGDFNKQVSIELPVNVYEVNFLIDKKKYTGKITQMKPLFALPFFEFDFNANKINFKGKIKLNYKNSFKKEIFEIIYGNDDFDGYVESTRNNNKIISAKLKNVNITGNFNEKGIYLSAYSLRFNDKKISGSIDNKRPKYIYDFKSSDLTEDQLFLFLLFHIYFLINEDAADLSSSSSSSYSPND